MSIATRTITYEVVRIAGRISAPFIEQHRAEYQIIVERDIAHMAMDTIVTLWVGKRPAVMPAESVIRRTPAGRWAHLLLAVLPRVVLDRWPWLVTWREESIAVVHHWWIDPQILARYPGTEREVRVISTGAPDAGCPEPGDTPETVARVRDRLRARAAAQRALMEDPRLPTITRAVATARHDDAQEAADLLDAALRGAP